MADNVKAIGITKIAKVVVIEQSEKLKLKIPSRPTRQVSSISVASLLELVSLYTILYVPKLKLLHSDYIYAGKV